ncbi:hypothetical protein GbCGDNIH6_8234 [Granulibacter bethesdensis]|nr:hypothetical protein GbCGDNIH6_8234 [Granulibacter bethesdensis]
MYFFPFAFSDAPNAAFRAWDTYGRKGEVKISCVKRKYTKA